MGNLRGSFPRFISDYPDEPEVKKAGRRNPGKAGGVYTYGGDKLMLKCETFKGKACPEKVIAGFMGQRMIEALVPGSTPETFLVSAKAKTRSIVPDESGHQVYLASVYYPGRFQSFHNIAFETDDSQRHAGQESVGMRKIKFRKAIFNKDPATGNYTDAKFPNYDKVTLATLQVGDFDYHSANAGVHDGTVKRIDFDESLADLSDDIHIHSHSRHRPFVGPTNHFREIPRHLKISEHFADASAEITSPAAQRRLRDATIAGLDEVAKFWGIRPIKKFAKHIGFTEASRITDKAELIIQLKGFLLAKLERRATSMQKLEMETRMSLCFTRVPMIGKPYFRCDENQFKALMHQDPVYFIKGDFHFRGKDQRWNFGLAKIRFKSLAKQAEAAVQANRGQLIVQAKESGRPEIMEAIELRDQLKTDEFKSDYIHSLSRFLYEMLKRCKTEGMAPVKNSIIDEILHEKSLPHRAKIIDRYILIYDAKDTTDVLKRAIRNALFDPSILRLASTKGESEKLKEFHPRVRAEAAARLAAYEKRTGHAYQPSKPKAEDVLLQKKWYQLSVDCEALGSKATPAKSGFFSDKKKDNTEAVAQRNLPRPVQT
jgi:hypothetical protein